MIQTQDLSFQYNPVEKALHFPDIHLKEEENLLILGKSGIGKTTLLHLLAGILSPLSGKIEIGDVEIHTLSQQKMDQFRGKHIGLVFQKNHAIEFLSVLENLNARLFFAKKTVAPDNLIDLLEKLNIADCIDKKINELSQGQLQRLGIAMSVIHSPQLILADEPTSSLDDENCTAVMELLINHAKANNANLIVITHDHRVKPLFKKTLAL